MLTKQEIIRKIEENRKTIRSYGVKKLVLFGSYAHNKPQKGSDIDFLVEFLPCRGLYDDYVHLLQFLSHLFKKEIDLVKPSLIREELTHSILGGVQVEAKI